MIPSHNQGKLEKETIKRHYRRVLRSLPSLNQASLIPSGHITLFFMNTYVLEELNGKFEQAKILQRKDRLFEAAYDEYLDFIGKSVDLAPIIQKLAIKDKFPGFVLYSMFISFMAPSLVNILGNTKIEFPPFWSMPIEEKFHLRQQFQNLTNEAYAGIYGLERQNLAPRHKDTPEKQSRQEKAFCKMSPYKLLETIHENILEEIASSIKHLSITRKNKLKKAMYDEQTCILTINGKMKIKLPIYENEASLCRVLFGKHKKDEPVEFSELHEEMAGSTGEETDIRKLSDQEFRSIYDAMRAVVNRRVCKKANVDENMLERRNKCVVRLV